MKQKKIYVTLSQFCEGNDEPRRLLKEAGFTVLENTMGRRILKEEMFDALRDADAVLAAVESYDAGLLSRLPKLRCISRCGASTDAIDLGAAEKYGKVVLATTDEVVEPVAQMTLAMILALARNFPLHLNDFRSSRWKKHYGRLLSEWRVGLIGFGRIGRKVEEYLRPFHCEILITDPFIKNSEVSKDAMICDLNTLLAESDLISVHVARPDGEGYLLGRSEISKMKRGSYLVNTSRGYLIDEEALVEALKSGDMAGCALDVFEKEPYKGPLFECPNVLATPHVATLTNASRTAMELRCAQNVVGYFKHLEKQ